MLRPEKSAEHGVGDASVRQRSPLQPGAGSRSARIRRSTDRAFPAGSPDRRDLGRGAGRAPSLATSPCPWRGPDLVARRSSPSVALPSRPPGRLVSSARRRSSASAAAISASRRAAPPPAAPTPPLAAAAPRRLVPLVVLASDRPSDVIAHGSRGLGPLGLAAPAAAGAAIEDVHRRGALGDAAATRQAAGSRLAADRARSRTNPRRPAGR